MPEPAINAGPPTVPRPAAAAIVVRDGDEGPEVLLVKRSPRARFMASTWVFPGGALERDAQTSPSEQMDDGRAHRAAAVRELREEAGIGLAESEDELVEFARWITPAQLKTRFDARFFIARLPAGQEPCVDGEECVDYRWLTPASALEAAREGELLLAFPTIRSLEQLSAFTSVDELVEHTRGRPVLPVEPRLRVKGDAAEILLPGDPGYSDS
jgi:8-oxo-dGTP pyrophosphatase MutT (NUDIX family)